MSATEVKETFICNAVSDRCAFDGFTPLLTYV